MNRYFDQRFDQRLRLNPLRSTRFQYAKENLWNISSLKPGPQQRFGGHRGRHPPRNWVRLASAPGGSQANVSRNQDVHAKRQAD